MTERITAERISATELLVRGPEAVREWREANRFQVPGHEFTHLYQRGHWDGTWAPGRWCRLIGDTWEMLCSMGLLSRLRRDLSVEGGSFGGADPALVEQFCMQGAGDRVQDLRDYQCEALRVALTAGWGRIALATNAGKGAVIALLAHYAAAHDLNALILCDELSVYDALLGEIRKWSKLMPRRIQAGARTPPKQPAVTLAMVPTLARRIGSKNKTMRMEWQEWVAGQHMLLLDEADKALAPSWKSVLRMATNSWWRIGFSGTFPTDAYSDLLFDELMGPVLTKIRNADLVERGVSAKPLVELQGFDATSSLIGLKLSWRIRGAARRQVIFERAIVRNEARHAAIAALVQPNTPTAIIVNRVEHGKLLARAIPGAEFLDGSASQAERLEVLDRFARGKLHVLVATKILDRGTNRLGVAADIILASGEGSLTQVLQRIGRGLRRAGGKEFLRLVDVVDRVAVDPNDQMLEQAAKFIHVGGRKRAQLYLDEGFESVVLL